jgi:hypothetical protein
MSGEDFTREEVASIYVESDDRYVVSLIVGYHDGAASGAMDAALAALETTRDGAQYGTVWKVHDRVTGEMHTFEQEQFDPECGALPPGTSRS